jgi:hypothetical protein
MALPWRITSCQNGKPVAQADAQRRRRLKPSADQLHRLSGEGAFLCNECKARPSRRRSRRRGDAARPFNACVFAGKSSWGRSNCNAFFDRIELTNAGPLRSRQRKFADAWKMCRRARSQCSSQAG